MLVLSNLSISPSFEGLSKADGAGPKCWIKISEDRLTKSGTEPASE